MTDREESLKGRGQPAKPPERTAEGSRRDRAQRYYEITTEVIADAKSIMEGFQRQLLPNAEKIETVYADMGYPSCTVALARTKEFPTSAWITVHCSHSQCYTQGLEISVTLRFQGVVQRVMGEREFSLDQPIATVQEELKRWLREPLAAAAKEYLEARARRTP